MSGIAIAARTIPGKVAPLAIWSSDASERIDSIRRSSATTRAGTRMPRLSSWAIRQRYESTRSRRISSIVSLRHAGRQPRDRRAARPRRSAGGRRFGGAAARPGHSRHRDEDADHARELRHADRAEPEAVQPERLDGEAADRVKADVREEEGAGARPQARAQQTDEQQEDDEIPQRLVEEGRMEVLELGVAERAVLGRDVELPRQIGRPPEGLFVEEIAPAADGLSEHHRRGGHVEPAENRQPPPIREPRADQRPDDETAVHGEAAFPHRDDLRRIAAVVIPVEDDLVEPRAGEPRQNRPLSGADDVVGRHAFAPSLAIAEPESDDDRPGHEDALPAADDRTALERDTARSPHAEPPNT